jgi:hypothetical protein
MIAGLRRQTSPVLQNGGYSLGTSIGLPVSKPNYSLSLKSNTQLSEEVINQSTHETMIIKRDRKGEMVVTRL